MAVTQKDYNAVYQAAFANAMSQGKTTAEAAAYAKSQEQDAKKTVQTMKKSVNSASDAKTLEQRSKEVLNNITTQQKEQATTNEYNKAYNTLYSSGSTAEEAKKIATAHIDSYNGKSSNFVIADSTVVNTTQILKGIEDLNEIYKQIDKIDISIQEQLAEINKSAQVLNIATQDALFPTSDYRDKIVALENLIDDIKKTDAYVTDLVLKTEIDDLSKQISEANMKHNMVTDKITNTLYWSTNVLDDTTFLEILESCAASSVGVYSDTFIKTEKTLISNILKNAQVTDVDAGILKKMLTGLDDGGIDLRGLQCIATKYGFNKSTEYKNLISWDKVSKATNMDSEFFPNLSRSSINLNLIANSLGDTAVTALINRYSTNQMVLNGEITEEEQFGVEWGMNVTDIAQNAAGTVPTVMLTEALTGGVGALTKALGITALENTVAATAVSAGVGMLSGTIIMVAADKIFDTTTSIVSGGEYDDFADLGKDWGDAYFNTRLEVEIADAQCNVELRCLNALRKRHGLEPIPIYDLEGNLID